MSNGHLCAWHRKWVNDFASASISLFLDGLRSNSITSVLGIAKNSNLVVLEDDVLNSFFYDVHNFFLNGHLIF